jgi:hypothetical protein
MNMRNIEIRELKSIGARIVRAELRVEIRLNITRPASTSFEGERFRKL